MKKEKPIIIIDCSNLIFRVYHVFKHLKNSKGIGTGTIYGFYNMLLYYSEQLKSRRFVLAWDSPKEFSCWREEIDPIYKQNRRNKYNNLPPDRQSSLDEITFAKEVIWEISKNLGIVNLKRNGYEADDLISLFVKMKKRYIKIVTADKDLLQLVDDKHKVRVYRPIKGNSYTIFNEAKVKDEFGVEPKLLPNLLSLTGDSTDNVKGIKGFGEKTAVKFIIEKGILDTPEKQNRYDTNMLLVNLRNGVPGDLKLSDLIIGKVNKNNVKQILDELEIKKFTAENLYDKLSSKILRNNILKLF